MAWWHRGQGGYGMTVKGRQKVKMKSLIKQLKSSPLFSVENQLRVTLRSAKDQFEEVNRKVNFFHHFLS